LAAQNADGAMSVTVAGMKKSRPSAVPACLNASTPMELTLELPKSNSTSFWVAPKAFSPMISRSSFSLTHFRYLQSSNASSGISFRDVRVRSSPVMELLKKHLGPSVVTVEGRTRS